MLLLASKLISTVNLSEWSHIYHQATQSLLTDNIQSERSTMLNILLIEGEKIHEKSLSGGLYY